MLSTVESLSRMPDLDLDGSRSPSSPRPDASKPDLTHRNSHGSNSHHRHLVLPHRLPQHTKDLPLTDIGTSPPAFEINSITHKDSRDSLESSELSDLGDDGSEAETDKMDFLDDDSASARDKVTDLRALSELTEMARLQEVDSDDSDDNFPKELSHEDALQLNGKHEGDHDEELERPVKQRRLLKLKRTSGKAKKEEDAESGTQESPSASSPTAATTTATDAVEMETAELTLHDTKLVIDDENVLAEEGDNEDAEEDDQVGAEREDVANGEVEAGADIKDEEEAEEPKEEGGDPANGSVNEELAKEEDPAENGSPADEEGEAGAEVEADVEDEKPEEGEQEEEEADADAAAKIEAEKIDEASVKEHQIAEENDVDMDEHRKLAVDELIAIEADFAHLRDKLYQDKLSLLEHELQLCLDGLHPELLQIYLKVNEFYQDNIRLANATLNYSLKCINTETIATRTAIHQDFMKNVMDMKNDMITETTLLWYKINKERNSLDQLVPDFNFAAIPTIPSIEGEPVGYNQQPIAAGGSSMEYYMDGPALSKKAMKQNILYELVQQRNSLNKELGILNGLKEFHGFPCAISTALHKDDSSDVAVDELILRKATNDEVEEDFRAMGISING